MAKIKLSGGQVVTADSSAEEGEKEKRPRATGRSLDANWLSAYGEYSSGTESPESFHLWTGLSVLASACRRNIWLDQGVYDVHPHLFVILVGPPGKVAKSTAIRMGRKILYGVEDIKFGPDSVTREELIRVLAKESSAHPVAAITIHSTELSSLIEPSGIKMIQFLTDIYDGDVKWQYATKGSGKDIVSNPSVNLLAGTTPSWVSEGMPADAVNHGFTSRVIFVFEDEPNELQPFPKLPDPALVKALTNDLDYISRIKGQFTWTQDGRDAYVERYKQIYGTKISDYRIEGFHWRKKVHILKVAMLLSIAENDSLEITEKEITVAWDLLTTIEPKMAKTFSAVGKYEHASDLERILNQINQSGGMSVAQIYQENYSVGDAETIGRIIQMLIQMGKVERTQRIRGGKAISMVVPAGANGDGQS
jgi:hypothetical protein